MLSTNELQSELKRSGITQRELVKQSGLSESVVSIIIKNAPRLLPHLIKALGKNPFASINTNNGDKMSAALEKLAKANPSSAIKDPIKWQKDIRKDRPLPKRINR